MRRYILLAAILCVGVQALLMPPKKKSADELSKLDDDTLQDFLNALEPVGPSGPEPRHLETTVTSKGCGWKGDTAVDRFDVEGTELAEYRWTVAIYRKATNSYAGVGSLIHPNVVLTVGYKFRKGGPAEGPWVVRAGEWRRSRDDDVFDYQARDVVEFISHPKAHFLRHNIGLMFVREAFDLDVHIGTICLPPQGTSPPVGETCIATGWGSVEYKSGKTQDIMKMVNLPIVGNDVCERQLRPLVGISYDLDPSMLCAGGVRDEDTCQADGGGPLVCSIEGSENRFYQVGIVSAGHGCGLANVPALYTKVSAFRDWVDKKMTEKGYNADFYTI